MFEKIKELLEKGLIQNDTATELNSEVMKALGVIRDEAKNHRLTAEDLKAKHDKALSDMELLKQNSNSNGGSDGKIKELEALVKNLMSENETTKQEKSKLAKDNEISKIVNGFENLTKSGKDFLAMKLDRELKDGFDVEVFKEGFKREHTDLFSSVGSGGSGAISGNGTLRSITATELKNMSLEDYNKIQGDLVNNKIEIKG